MIIYIFPLQAPTYIYIYIYKKNKFLKRPMINFPTHGYLLLAAWSCWFHIIERDTQPRAELELKFRLPAKATTHPVVKVSKVPKLPKVGEGWSDFVEVCANIQETFSRRFLNVHLLYVQSILQKFPICVKFSHGHLFLQFEPKKED